MSGAVIVTEVAEFKGHEVPVEALIFPPNKHMVIYSRLLTTPEVVANLPHNFPVGDLFYDVVLN